ncbi:integrase arm-type DNA-binding domain-containing protein [Microbulbifer sp. GL-2]|uniref:tyrosine-type recombinase/integrase n=1 Tax=Microbulbifer sp. GL-2 TaxID=2591606 RepID=UPI001161D469|nr:integrase arm-type DNA-binding domain-containing protein [Microbulbifer sp. GL-2]BBM02045.1 integrase [Microbulbifer sp. GL-2]
MALTDTQIKQAKPSDKDQWLTDQQGLRLLIKPNGSKYWRLKYRFKGRQKTLALGVYPSVSLKQARQKVAEAKQLLAEDRDPSAQKRVEKHQARVNIDLSFAAVAEEWWNHQKGTWTEDHANRVWTRLRDNTFPRIGQRPIADLHPQDVIAIVRDIEERDAMDVAQRVLQDIRRVCRYAVQVGKLTHNPAIELTGILRSRKSNHRASLPREELPGFLKELDLYQKRGRILTKLAIQLLILTFVRPGELRCARWEEFDFESALWRIPGDRMKMGTDHIVPLSSQALSALEELKSLTGQYSLLFPSERERARPMSDNTMRKAIFKMGWDGSQEGRSKANPHGFRATASSILNETGFNPDAIERQLSHMERNGVRAAYTHHARYMDERKEMMQWWANYLDEMRGSGKVVPIFAQQS